jgi:glutamyl-tRNA synthetase
MCYNIKMIPENPTKKVITRFPPSPTGTLHVGSVRTALYNYIYSKQNSGKFVLRIEDTDRERSKVEYEKDIISGLEWLGLKHDNEIIIRQSENHETYKKYLEKLVSEGKAYISKEEVKEAGQRDSVIRFKNPNLKITFTDLIRGDISFDTTELGDFIIAKSLSEPLYHLAVVIDDHEAGVTHVIRGEDGLSNTPRQILIGEAIGASRPFYAHLPLILDKDRAKLSKRKHGEKVSLDYYKKRGFLKEAIINYLVMVGWNPGGEKEVYSLEEIINIFRIDKIQKAGAVFDEEKLSWMNKNYLQKMDNKSYYTYAEKFFPDTYKNNILLLEKIIASNRDRVSYGYEFTAMCKNGDFEYFFNEPEFPKEKLIWKGEGDLSMVKKHLEKAIDLLSKVSEDKWNAIDIKESIWPYADEVGRGNVLWPIRYCLSGKDKSPDPFTLAEILGKSKTIARLEKVKNAL